MRQRIINDYQNIKRKMLKSKTKSMKIKKATTGGQGTFKASKGKGKLKGIATYK